MKPTRLIILLTLPVAIIAYVAVVWYLAEHDAYGAPDPATNHIIEMQTRDGHPYYVTPWEKSFHTWLPVGVLVFTGGWSWVARKTRPAKPEAKQSI